jgi:hypothetical protein
MPCFRCVCDQLFKCYAYPNSDWDTDPHGYSLSCYFANADWDTDPHEVYDYDGDSDTDSDSGSSVVERNWNWNWDTD